MLSRFFAYYRPHRRLFLLDFGCAVVSGLLELVFPLAVKAFVDRLLPSQDWGLILGATAALLGIYLAHFLQRRIQGGLAQSTRFGGIVEADQPKIRAGRCSNRLRGRRKPRATASFAAIIH